MKKWLIRILLVLVAVGALAGAGFAGYRIGLSQGVQLSGNFDDAPRFVERFHKAGMPEFQFGFHRNDRGFNREFGPGGFHGRGFGFMSPLFVLLKIALFSLIAWGVYKLFTGNGWQLSFTRQPAETTSAAPEETPAAKKPKGKQ
ncbi:MAG TPA: hypothetical protein VMJ90_05720 [Anaerolineales bacterium]|nr:hypothetical protein [Anaerolineales bacterium]